MNIKIERTLTPKPKPPSDKLGFGQHFTDHMFVMDYTTGRGWHDPVIIPYSPLVIDPASLVFHYGQAVFEGLKAYRADDGRVLMFRPEKNFERLNASDERLCIPHIDVEQAIGALIELVKLDADWIPSAPGTSLYIRPFVIATEAVLGVRPSGSYKFIIILSPVGSYYPEGINPIKIFIEDKYVRAVRGGIGETKGSANYVSGMKGQAKAQAMGYSQVLWLDAIDRKYIEEVGAMNVFFKIDGELITPELSGSILPGITRDSVIKLASSWGVHVVERKISVFELFEAHEKGILEEAFGSGTAAVISPIGKFNWQDFKITVGDGDIGAFSRHVYDELTGIQYGKRPDKFGWVRVIE
ncbi:MAG: branched-chain amino acid aminotransferase [Defluviitaleaceae bacterium]|nr:branched-chain amino acid aminotransferase [Defluviitaleaceae bacterium]